MARIRSIKPEFWTSEQIVECSPNARLMFVGLWTFADDNGIHPTNPMRIKMQVFPADDISSADIRRMLDELSLNGLIEIYDVDGKEFFRITGWGKHQKIDQPTYRFPLPSGEVPENVRRTFSERSPREWSGVDRSGEEEKKKRERQKTEDAPPKATPQQRGTRLPEDWVLPDDWAEWARIERPGIDVETEAAKFADHWWSKPGKEARKLKWESTWRNWVRNVRSASGSVRHRGVVV